MAEWIMKEETDIDGVDCYIRKGELIRCKDCKYSSPNRKYGCRINSFADDIGKQMYADDFCSIAERKEE